MSELLAQCALTNDKNTQEITLKMTPQSEDCMVYHYHCCFRWKIVLHNDTQNRGVYALMYIRTHVRLKCNYMSRNTLEQPRLHGCWSKNILLVSFVSHAGCVLVGIPLIATTCVCCHLAGSNSNDLFYVDKKQPNARLLLYKITNY